MGDSGAGLAGGKAELLLLTCLRCTTKNALPGWFQYRGQHKSEDKAMQVKQKPLRGYRNGMGSP